MRNTTASPAPQWIILPDDCDAFEIIELLGLGMDFLADADQVKWKAFFTPKAYDLVQADSEAYLYSRNGVEYVKVWDNHSIPLIIHMRVAGIGESISASDPPACGFRREIDRQ